MAVQFVDLFERQALDRAISFTHVAKVRLFKNDWDPEDDDDISDPEECDFSGYGEVDMDMSADWFDASTTAGVTTKTANRIFRFQHDGGGTANDVYGWYVVSNDGSELWFAERFAGAPITLSAAPQKIDLVPELSLKDTLDA